MSQAVLSTLKSKFGKTILDSTADFGDECIVIAADKLIEVCTFLRDDDKMSFDSPVFLTCIDRLGQDRKQKADTPRFELVVQLRSIAKRHRIRVKVLLQEDSFKVPSLSAIWSGFNWQEREAYDMYGIEFVDHPDLRRIFLYEEFKGYPLRKDYPIDKRQPLARRDWADE